MFLVAGVTIFRDWQVIHEIYSLRLCTLALSSRLRFFRFNIREYEDCPMREKRSHKRQGKPAEQVVRYEIQGEFNPGDGARTAVVTDLSSSGMGLFTDEPLELGQVLKFIDTGERREVSDRGQVIWTADSPEGRRVGIKFI
jgi:hypothetical protein